MTGRVVGWAFMAGGAGIILAGMAVGLQTSSLMMQGGPAGYWAGFHSGRFIFFSLSYPIGLALGLVGASLVAGLRGGRFWVLVGAAAVSVYGVSPQYSFIISGPHPWFFGLNGGLITAFLFVIFISWAKDRPWLSGRSGATADLRLISHLCFGVAAWQMCGLGGFPVWALHPEKVIGIDTLPVAINVTAKASIYLTIGFFFSGLAQFLAWRNAAERKPD